MSVTVRPAVPGDAAAVRSVADRAWWATYPGVLSADTIRDAVADLYDEAFLRQVIEGRDDILFLVAEDEPTAGGDPDLVIGFATARQTWADEVELHTLYVDPDRWGEGTGTALLEAVAESARAGGADRIRCEVADGNHVGRAFLEARGFDQVGTVATDVGDETVREAAFEKPL